MCFSAGASFLAGGVLTAVGIAAVRQVKKPAHFAFAAIPLCFAVQQFAEGFVWLSFADPFFEPWHTPAKYLFLTFAQIIWPFLIPLAFLLIEPTPKVRKILRCFLAGGIVVSLVFGYRLLFLPAVARIDGCHVEYELIAPFYQRIFTGVLYLGAIVVAPFFSSWKRTKVLASVNVLSLLVTQLFYEAWFVSVWCFFAALQSVIIVMVMREIRGTDEAKLHSLNRG